MADRKVPPRITARSRGTYNNVLTNIAEAYRSANPSKDVRMVYAPQHRPEHSKIMRRQSEGYEFVTRDELGIDTPGGKAGEQVRVGDTVLMAIDKDVLAANAEYMNQLAKDDARRVQDSFYNSQAEFTAGEHTSKPLGRISSSTEEKELKLREPENRE